MRTIALAVVALLALSAVGVRAGDSAPAGTGPTPSEQPAAPVPAPKAEEAAPAPATKAEESPALLDEPPPGAFVAARGWDRVEFSNETEAPVRLRAYLRLPKTGKWRQFRFPKDRENRPRFFKPSAPAGKLEFLLAPGDRVGWTRYGRAEMAFQIFDSAGEDLSANFRFRADRPTVAITKPDAWMRGDQGSGDSNGSGGRPPGMGPSAPPGMAPAPGTGPQLKQTSGPADGQPD